MIIAKKTTILDTMVSKTQMAFPTNQFRTQNNMRLKKTNLTISLMCGARFFFSVVAMHSHLYCVGQISVLCWSVSTFFTCNLLLVLSAAIIGYHYKARKIIFETICWGFQFSSSFRISVNHFEPFLRSSLPNHDLCPNTPGDSHCNQPWILAKSCPML